MEDNGLFSKTGSTTKPVFTQGIVNEVQRKDELVKGYMGGTTPDFHDKQGISIGIGLKTIFLKMIFEEMQKENILKNYESYNDFLYWLNTDYWIGAVNKCYKDKL